MAQTIKCFQLESIFFPDCRSLEKITLAHSVVFFFVFFWLNVHPKYTEKQKHCWHYVPFLNNDNMTLWQAAVIQHLSIDCSMCGSSVCPSLFVQSRVIDFEVQNVDSVQLSQEVWDHGPETEKQSSLSFSLSYICPLFQHISQPHSLSTFFSLPAIFTLLWWLYW